MKPQIRIQRINNDLKDIQNSACKTKKKDDLNWICQMDLTSQCPFYGFPVQLNIYFPQQYPFDRPIITMIDSERYFHPNISTYDGSICNTSVKSNEISMEFKDRLEAIINLLNSPNPNSCLNTSAGKLFLENFNEYYKKALLQFRRKFI